MAMYFFASRLSLAVCYRRDETPPRSSPSPRPHVCRHHGAASPQPSTSASTTTAIVETAPFSTIRSGPGASSRKAQPVPPPRVPARPPPLPTVSETVPMPGIQVPGVCHTSTLPRVSPSALQLSSQRESPQGIQSPTTSVPSDSESSHHRVRFTNTFPRSAAKNQKSLQKGAGGHVTSRVGGGEQNDQTPQPVVESDCTLIFKDGKLVSGSLDALIQHTVPTNDYYPDKSFLFAFLLSSRLFIKPHELLSRITIIWEKQQKTSTSPQASSKDQFVPRLVQLMAEWSETFPYDFRDERVMAHVRSITQSCVSVAGSAGEARVRLEVSTLLQNLLHKLTALEKYEEFLLKESAMHPTNNTEDIHTTDVADVCPNAASLAQQLTHIELERLSFIGPEEFVQAFAKDNPNLEASFKDIKKTRNLESYVSWFNRLSYFVATEIVKLKKKKQRVRVVELWIETASECFIIGNFNSLMAIITGLNMSSISRLKKTWQKVQIAKFSALEHQMDPSSNFRNYRSLIKTTVWSEANSTDNGQKVVIPFFSLLVKDLFSLNEGCTNRMPNGHINFEKFWQLAKKVTEVMSWKHATCHFEKLPRVITLLQTSAVLTENALALASFECEPPDTNPEKELLKSLKLEETVQQ